MVRGGGQRRTLPPRGRGIILLGGCWIGFMGRWLVGGGVKKRGGNEVISNGSYLREDVGCGMEFGVWMRFC